MASKSVYIATIGLEVHAQLLTASKMFSPERTSYGELPNTYTSPITLAHPGTMPSLNKKAVEDTIRMGLACRASITKYNKFARKNYFYPDLAKGYQITQDKTPLCTHGYILIKKPEEKKICIDRIHLEEDTAKSIHGMIPNRTLLDFNRAGSPLIEIVTAPVMAMPEEAFQFLVEIRRLVRYLGICDGNMEEGSLRCDANVSVRKRDDSQLGQKVEVKNINSMRHVQIAIAYEIERQKNILDQNGKIVASTRSYEAKSGTTIHQRNKESMSEYRYFPEPDLSPLVVDVSWVDRLKTSMPLLPRELTKKFMDIYKLSSYDVGVLIENKNIALFFESICKHTKHYKAVANWVIGPIKSYLNQAKIDVDFFPIQPSSVAKLADMVVKGLLNFSIARSKLFPQLLKSPEVDPYKLAEKEGLLQKASWSELESLIHAVLDQYPDKVQAYKKGKKGLMGFFMGEVMKLSKGKANPKEAMSILQKKI